MIKSADYSDVKKLPLWAQRLISYLERDLETAKAELVRRDANVQTNIVVNRYSDTPVFLPNDEEVAFLFPDKKGFDAEYIEFRFNRYSRGVSVMASTFRDSLAFLPESGNCGTLAFVPRPSR